MNNKQIGTEFEQEMCDLLARKGYWAHFITPDIRGAQPFDIIAVKNGKALAIDCKTSVRKTFPITRLEDNQITAFEKWIRCGNEEPLIAVKYNGLIYMVRYTMLRECRSISLDEVEGWAQ